MPIRKSLQKKLEKVVKSFVKRRDDYTCQKCRAKVWGIDCHASHVIPVSGGNQFKFDPLNLKVLCFVCHRWWHENPKEAKDWFRERFPDRYQYLFGQTRKNVKLSVFDLEELILEYE